MGPSGGTSPVWGSWRATWGSRWLFSGFLPVVGQRQVLWGYRLSSGTSSCVSLRRLLENFLLLLLAWSTLGNLEHFFVASLYLAVLFPVSRCCSWSSGFGFFGGAAAQPPNPQPPSFLSPPPPLPPSPHTPPPPPDVSTQELLFLCETLAFDMNVDGTVVAKRRRERRLRPWWRHGRMSIARAVEGATDDALRGKNTVTKAREGKSARSTKPCGDRRDFPRGSFRHLSSRCGRREDGAAQWHRL